MASTLSTRDRQLISKSFKLMCTGIENVTVRDHLNKDLYYNFFSSAVGDNRYINPIPQFSPATDPRYTQFMSSSLGGMGTQYKKTFDDNASLVTFTVGVAEFTGILTFISRMFDPAAAIMANKGRSPSIGFYIGQGLGTIAFWPIQLISISFSFLNFLMDVPRNQFYYVKPAMGMYLTAANNFLNDITTGMGVIKPVLGMKRPPGAPINGVDPEDYASYQEELSRLNTLFPDSINADGTIDVIRLVSRGARKYRFFLSELEKLNEKSITTASEKYEQMAEIAKSIQFGTATMTGEGMGVNDYLKKELNTTGSYREQDEYKYPEKASAYTDKDAYVSVVPQNESATTASVTDTTTLSTAGTGTTATTSGTSDGNTRQPEFASTSTTAAAAEASSTAAYTDVTDKSWAGQVMDLVKTAWYGGMDAITWRVAHQGAVTDSFSNSATASPLADKFNTQTRAFNDFKFDMGGFNTGLGMIDGVINSFTQVAQGLANSIAITNVPMALANNAYVEVPDHWAESSASLHRETYRFYFEATYAHPYSQITGVWLPISLLMPMILPLSAGPSAHTSPFLVKVFAKGRSIIRTGMVDSATFTFGEGPGGWTRDRKPLNCAVDITIVDLHKTIAMPISRTVGALDLTNPADAVNRMLTDAGKYNDYVSRLASVDYLDTVLRWNKLSNRLTRATKSVEQSLSAGNMAGIVNDSIVGDIGRIFHNIFPR